MADESVLEPKLFFLKAVKKVHVGMRAVFLFRDGRVERRMFRGYCVDMCLVHLCHPFDVRW